MATAPQGNVGKPTLGPSESMSAMFRSCSKDPTEVIATRLEEMLDKFLQHYKDKEANKNTTELAVDCCSTARRWYYNFLENLVTQETKKREISDLSGFFANDPFQRLLVVCSLEIVIAAKGLSNDFTQLYEIFQLLPYIFWKEILAIVNAAERELPALLRHCGLIRVKIFKSLVWTSDSPLWEDIKENGGRFPICQQVLLPKQIETSTGRDSNFESHHAPEGASLNVNLSTAFPPQSSTSTANRSERSNHFHLFARNIYTMMGGHLRELCATLGICDELRLKIWTCFEHSLVFFSSLMEDRHLDQLLMCAIALFSRMTKNEITIEQIMSPYNSLPYTSESVFSDVLICGGDIKIQDQGSVTLTPTSPSAHYPTSGLQERGSLTKFFNQVYVMHMHTFAEQFGPNYEGDTPPLSPYPVKTPSTSRKQLSSNHSIFISRLESKTFTPCESGYTCTLYSSPSQLREITNKVKEHFNRHSYALQLDTEGGEEGEEGPSAKRVCPKRPSALEIRIMDMANDCAKERNKD